MPTEFLVYQDREGLWWVRVRSSYSEGKEGPFWSPQQLFLAMAIANGADDVSE